MSIITCTSPIDCEDNNITPEEILFKVTQIDENGCPAINTVAVEAAGECEPFITCENKEMGYKSLIKQLITTDENGCWAVRIIQSNA